MSPTKSARLEYIMPREWERIGLEVERIRDAYLQAAALSAGPLTLQGV